MLDLRLSRDQSLVIETPSGGVEVCVLDVRPQDQEATIEVLVPDDWTLDGIPGRAYRLHEEFVVDVPDGQIRLKLLRFRPNRDGTAGSVAIGIDAPRDWAVLR
jgi:hypothetical protein